MNPQDAKESKLRRILIAWTVLWAAAVLFLIVYWHDLPSWISWPLAILEALTAPDLGVLKETLLGKKASSEGPEA